MQRNLPRDFVRQRSQSPSHYEALDRLFARIGQLSSLPAVAQRVLQVAGDCDSNAHDLLEVVEQDPTLAIRILRTVNSSYCGLRNEVSDLQAAIALLGFVEVRNLALTVYVARLSEGAMQYKCFTRLGLWKHMVATAVVARLIAQSCHRANPEEAYLAGLLHDIGQLLIDQYMTEQFHRVIDAVSEGENPTTAESRIFTFDHTALGAYVAQQCGLPDHVCAAIAHHHAPHECFDRDRELLHVLVAANFFASRHGYPSLGVDTALRPGNDVLRGLGLRESQFQIISDQLAEALADAEVLASI